MFIGLSAFNITGFNRTFMELKFLLHGGLSVTRRKFQSYLYGIEMIKRCYTCLSIRRFNRTFMELKCKFSADFSANVTEFQSYLYGIEIRY